MDEIIEKILSSPALSLPPGGCNHLQHLISNMQVFTLDEFKRIAGIFLKICPDSPLNQADILKNIELFMQDWVNIATMISRQYEKILLIWKRLHNDAMGADYNLPIILKLLPNNAVILRLLANKLESSTSIFSSGKLAYTLVDLSVATEYKLRSASFKKSHSYPNLFSQVSSHSKNSVSKSTPNLLTGRSTNPEKSSSSHHEGHDKYDITARIIKQDLKRMDLVRKYHSLLAVHKLYSESLDSEIYFKLSTESPDIYSKYTSFKKEEMIQHIIDELRGNPLISDALNILIEKRICMIDFDYTLHLKECTIEHVLRLFTEKFAHFKDIMESQPNKFNVSLKSIHSYYMLPAYAISRALPINTAETQFNEEAKRLGDYMDGARAAVLSATSAASTTAAAAAAAAVTTLSAPGS